MARKRPELIEVRQGLDERFLRGILTRDISPVEAVFDLIDNSIDAARNDLLAKGSEAKDKFGLPISYAGYRVTIRITNLSVVVSDNCHGFEKSTLQEDAFIIGRPSSHPQGIGYFGVGLKRALLALGSSFSLKTNRPGFAAELKMTAEQMSLRKRRVMAVVKPARPTPRTTVAVTDLRPGAAHDFSGNRDFPEIQKALARRYGPFIRKGLQISLNGTKVSPFAPTVRQRGPVRPKKWHSTIGNVSVFVEAGMHARYRATLEKDYDREVNANLTDQYGWYIVCNDRTIEVATKDNRFGFSTYWHPEYNGFVGWVHFVAEDPADLPWNTKKTEIDPRTPVFQGVVNKLKEFSDDFRRENRTARKKPKSNPKKPTKKKGTVAKPRPGGAPTPPKPHVNEWDSLLPNIPLNWSDAKLSSLLAEAEDLQIDFSYSGCSLLRMVVERAVDQHIRRSKRLEDIKKAISDEQAAAGRAFTRAQFSNFEPTLGNILDWMKKNPQYFPSDVRSDCSHAVSKFSIALSKTINGAMHKSTIVDRTQLVAIRNEVYPLLDFLLTTPPVPPK